MATSRRSFLKSGTMCALFVGIPGVVTSIAKGIPLDVANGLTGNSLGLTRAMFIPHLNSTFRFRAGARVVKATLVGAKDLKAGAKSSLMAGKESFSLLFVGSKRSARLTDDIYRVEHPALGKFSLFVAPVGQPQHRQYEAIITRL